MHEKIFNEQFVTAKMQNDVVQSRMSIVVCDSIFFRAMKMF